MISLMNVDPGVIDWFRDWDREQRVKTINFQSKKLRNQRRQLRELQEKCEAMQTWRGIFRTIGQKLGFK